MMLLVLLKGNLVLGNSNGALGSWLLLIATQGLMKAGEKKEPPWWKSLVCFKLEACLLECVYIYTDIDR